VTLAGSGLSGVEMLLNESKSGWGATTNGSGNYSFSVPAGGSYTLKPSLSGYTFNPISQTFNSLGSNQTANFVASC